MKTIKQLLKQEPVFLNEFNDKIDVIGNFENIYMSGEEYHSEKPKHADSEYWKEKKKQMDEALKKYKNIKIIFASYGNEDYSGSAFVLFIENNKLYEVNGSHCSCMGLECQWEPEETTLEVLKHRLIEGRLGKESYSGNNFNDELKKFIGID